MPLSTVACKIAASQFTTDRNSDLGNFQILAVGIGSQNFACKFYLTLSINEKKFQIRYQYDNINGFLVGPGSGATFFSLWHNAHIVEVFLNNACRKRR